MASDYTLGKGDKVTTWIRSLVKSEARIDIAVPFWGKGAVDKLKISEKSDFRIVCNLESGGCNPHEIEKLINKIGPKNVKSLANLHAKIYVNGRGAIVGSSNVSASGMPELMNSGRGLIEANIHTKDPAMISEVSRLFGEIWKDAKRIKPAMLTAAKNKWDARESSRSGNVGGATTLSDLLSDLNLAKNVFIYKYDGGLSKEAKNILKKVKSNTVETPKSIANSPEPNYNISLKGADAFEVDPSFLEDLKKKKEDLKAGDFIIMCSKGRKSGGNDDLFFRSCMIYILSINLLSRDVFGLLVPQNSILSSGRRLSISSSEKKLISAKVSEYYNQPSNPENPFVPLWKIMKLPFRDK